MKLLRFKKRKLHMELEFTSGVGSSGVNFIICTLCTRLLNGKQNKPAFFEKNGWKWSCRNQILWRHSRRFRMSSCFKIPRTTPIYQCEQGHIHCKKCHPRLRDCPICRGSIGNTRNLVAEKIISKLPVRCTNFEKGCEEPQALPDQITEHEKYCEFRMVNCFYEGCKDSVPLKQPCTPCRTFEKPETS